MEFSGKTTTYNYDLLRRLLSRTPDASFGESADTYMYTPTGQRASMQDASGTTSYTYDARERVLTKTTPQGTLTYTYDATGNVASVRSSNANGVSANYAWDAANQLIDHRGDHRRSHRFAQRDADLLARPVRQPPVADVDAGGHPNDDVHLRR